MSGNKNRWSTRFGQYLLLIVMSSLFHQIQCNRSGDNEPQEITFDYLDDHRDHATAITIDREGNICVTGRSNGGETHYDFATVKYSPAGIPFWAARYNGPANGEDLPSAIAVGSSGTIYVTGSSEGTGTSYDYATVKYDGEGIMRWVKRYNGAADGNDRSTAMTLDRSGNVIVTGRSQQEGAFSDYTTVKYRSDGVQLWESSYDGPGSGDDIATAIAVDSDGNIYVTGRSTGTDSSLDYATIKYSPEGAIRWVSRYNGPGNGEDRAESMTIDNRGNIYVTGTSVGDKTAFDWATISYDPNGNTLWSARYNAEGSSWDGARAIEVDGLGNAYTTGYGGKGRDYITIKYDQHGNELWVSKHDGRAHATDVAVAIRLDRAGNSYVTGYCNEGVTHADYVTIKYDPLGKSLWISKYNGSADSEDRGRAIAIDRAGDIYLTGESRDIATDFDFATIKYDKDGNELWIARYDRQVADSTMRTTERNRSKSQTGLE